MVDLDVGEIIDAVSLASEAVEEVFFLAAHEVFLASSQLGVEKANGLETGSFYSHVGADGIFLAVENLDLITQVDG